MITRCKWCNLNNPRYVKYHDEEWGVLNIDDSYLYEMLILEMFQAGLSFECILNKRENFKKAYSNFNIDEVINYTDEDINRLFNDKGNSKIFKSICDEYVSFYNYLKTFTKGNIYHENDNTRSELSDTISKDLKKRGMKFVGTIIIYSYLQAIGIINSHEDDCFFNPLNHK